MSAVDIPEGQDSETAAGGVGPPRGQVSTDDEILGEERKRSIAPWVALGAGVVVLVLVAAVVIFGDDSDVDDHLIGEVAPPVVGETLDGGTFDLGDHAGEWAVVNFFASWCPPCRVEHPELTAFSEEHEQAGDAVLVGVVFSDTPEKAARFFEELGGNWPAIVTETGSIVLDYGVIAAPETYMVDPEGIIVAKFTGAVTADELDAVIDSWEGPS